MIAWAPPRSITDTAGVPFYNHFASKEALAVVASFFTMVFDVLLT
jgi:hypothetical protein